MSKFLLLKRWKCSRKAINMSFCKWQKERYKILRDRNLGISLPYFGENPTSFKKKKEYICIIKRINKI
jgi:hypothetical protein